jgi:hypothetical protein
MAFIVTKPADLLALKDELALVEYAPYLDETKKLLRMFNDPAKNAGGENISTPLSLMTIASVGMEIEGGEFSSLTTYDKIWLRTLISRPVDEEMAPFVKKFRAMFAPASLTMQAVDLVRSHPASRGEIMFGAGTMITRYDVNTARDS